MTEHGSTRWTARGALALALLALGVSAWGAGCRERASAPANAEPSRPSAPAEPLAKTTVVKVTPVSTARELVAKAPEAKTKSSAATAESLRVRRLVLTHAIEKREPVPATELTLGGKPVMAFLEVANSGDQEETVEVSFESGKTSVGHVKLSIPPKSSRWRTWGQSRNVKEAGEWQAVVRSSTGVELARTAFTVSGS